MASPGQQKMRKYSYGFNGQSGYQRLLSTVHKNITAKMQLEQDKQGAKILENFLQNIKDIARVLMEQTSSRNSLVKQADVATRIACLSGELVEWYKDLVNEVIQVETNARKKKGLEKLSGNKYNLFKRAHSRNKVDTNTFDDIFEEELASLFAVLEKRINNKTYKMKDINIDIFGTGKTPGQILGTEVIEELSKDFHDGVAAGLQEVAKNQKIKASTQVLGKEFKKQVAIKTDIQNLALDINATFGLDDASIDKIIPLLNEATFTAKNYLNTTIAKNGLELGETNLLRSIMGILGVAFPSNRPIEWRDMFYRGAQIMTKTNSTPSAAPTDVMMHFYHMRFAYELSGLGLIDATTFKPLFAKYLIYNEPDGNKIHVFDTASLILEEFGNKSIANTFGRIALHRNFNK